MEWKEWIGKKVFIKLIDGTIFSFSIVLNCDEHFISISDKFGKQVTISKSEIMRIKEEMT